MKFAMLIMAGALFLFPASGFAAILVNISPTEIIQGEPFKV